ncbi:Cof-type HAD-IIB family hydrolase [Paenibacillus terrigena]|uniref:Cof-type HAD-IIB family hydrolase n=1 Tax=Paenibacillus terrigena TaxID=369333 RepID=UPI00036F00EF|nr:Cof-type HAD-IIB family hydrolase [Paenibacillus terrigena]
MGRPIVFFDIDGTLLNENKEILASTRIAIHELQQQGIYTAIATGRTPILFEEIRQSLGIDSYVALNGQYVVFEGQVIYDNPIPQEELINLQIEMQRNNHPYAHVSHDDFKSSVANHPYIRDSFGDTKIVYPEVDPTFHLRAPIYQAIVFCEEDERSHYIDRFPHFTFLPWHTYALDILPKGCSKAIGITKMLEYGDFELADSYAFGDNNNDLEMLSLVGTGVAMGNALPETKAVADMITTSCNEDGIYHGLVKLGLIAPVLQKQEETSLSSQ